MGLVIVVVVLMSRLQHSRSPKVCPSLQFSILFHQFLHVSNECLNLLGHYDWSVGGDEVEVSMCLEELYWKRYDDLLKKIATQLVPTDGAKLMK